MTRPRSEFEEVQDLFRANLNNSEISRRTGIPRTTVRDWRRGRIEKTPRFRLTCSPGSPCSTRESGVLAAGSYAYLLGLYLGDGYVAPHPRVWRLRIVLDSRYPAIIDACAAAMQAVLPTNRIYRLPRPGCVEVSMYSKHWPCLLPQYGKGRKHERPINLERWQQEIVEAQTEAFLRGLIHSDGCRIVANDRGTKSVRYHFSNLSEDIKGLFCAALDLLDVQWTRPCDRQIAVYRKASVAKLDEFIGPKR